MNNIIIPEEFKRKLKELQKENSVIFVTGHAGVGKTCVVQEYLKNKKITYTYLRADQMEFKEIIQQQKNGLFIIDDFHNILSENETYLKEHFYELLRSHRFFLLSRAHMPSWLKVYRMIGQVGCVDGSALKFSEQDIREYLKMNQIDVDDTEIYQIVQETKGYPLAIACLAFRLKTGITDNKKLKEKALKDVFDYYDEAVAHIWSRELYLFLIQMGGFESFSLGLASMVSGYHDVQQLIREANKTGSFLELNEEKYVVTPFFQKYLSYK